MALAAATDGASVAHSTLPEQTAAWLHAFSQSPLPEACWRPLHDRVTVLLSGAGLASATAEAEAEAEAQAVAEAEAEEAAGGGAGEDEEDGGEGSPAERAADILLTGRDFRARFGEYVRTYAGTREAVAPVQQLCRLTGLTHDALLEYDRERLLGLARRALQEAREETGEEAHLGGIDDGIGGGGDGDGGDGEGWGGVGGGVEEERAESAASAVLLFHVEEYFFVPLQAAVYAVLEAATAERERRLRLKLKALSSLPQTAFELAPGFVSPGAWQPVVAALRALESRTLPSAKARMLRSAARQLYATAAKDELSKQAAAAVAVAAANADQQQQQEQQQQQQQQEPSVLGADDFLPIFIFALVQACIAPTAVAEKGGGAGGLGGGIVVGGTDAAANAFIEEPVLTMELLRLMADPLRLNDEVTYYVTMLEVAVAYLLEYSVVCVARLPLPAAPGRPLGVTLETDFYGSGAMLRSVAPGSEAERVIVRELQLRPGDDGPALVAINGERVVGLQLGRIINMLRDAVVAGAADVELLFVSAEEYYTTTRVL